MRPFDGRRVLGFAGTSNGRTTAAPPRATRMPPLVTSLRIIVLLPLEFPTRASTVISLTSWIFTQEKDTCRPVFLIL